MRCASGHKVTALRRAISDEDYCLKANFVFRKNIKNSFFRKKMILLTKYLRMSKKNSNFASKSQNKQDYDSFTIKRRHLSQYEYNCPR